MEPHLKVLLLEDVATDADLVRIELHQVSPGFEMLQVKTEADFKKALTSFVPDVILADYWLPSYDGITALGLAQEAGSRAPFIFVSGAIGEDLATETLRRGATDYVSKDRLNRLGPAVQRALRERDELDKRRSAEAALLASELKYRTVFTSAASIIILLGPDGTITDHNPRAREALGDDLIGRSFLSLAHPDDTARLAAALSGLPSSPVQHQCRLQGPDRNTLEITLNASSSPDDRDNAIVIIEDVTERRRLEKMVLQAQKLEAVGRLAGGVAHDFNNLLTVVENCCERLLVALPIGDRRREEVTEIRHAGNFAATLTRRLLSFGNRDVVQVEKLELSDLVRQVIPLLKRMIGPTITLEAAVPDGTIWVEADRGQIEQVLLNLADNAREAMPEGGRLTLDLETVELADPRAAELGLAPGRYARLLMTDTGAGIPLSDQRHIFEPFFSTKSGGSAGLGLSTIYGIVRQAEGGVHYQGAPGTGAAFEVHLPLREPAAAEIPEPIDDYAGTETVLVVEDEEVVRQVVKLILSPWGYRVLEATCGAEALEIWKERAAEIDLVITDIVMPGLSGRELTQRLTADRPELRSLFISGHAEELAGRREGEEEFHFLYKPFSSEAMLKKVRRLLDRPLSPAASV